MTNEDKIMIQGMVTKMLHSQCHRPCHKGCSVEEHLVFDDEGFIKVVVYKFSVETDNGTIKPERAISAKLIAVCGFDVIGDIIAKESAKLMREVA